MKKWMAIAVGAMIFAMTACGNGEKNETTTREEIKTTEQVTIAETTAPQTKPVETTTEKLADVKKVTVFYTDADSDDYALTKVTVNVPEGSAENILTQVFQNPKNGNVIPLMPKNAKINSIKIDGKQAIIDFDKAFVLDMNVGSGMESALVECIVNTVGAYYGVDFVRITVNGGDFETGHNLYSDAMEVTQK